MRAAVPSHFRKRSFLDGRVNPISTIGTILDVPWALGIRDRAMVISRFLAAVSSTHQKNERGMWDKGRKPSSLANHLCRTLIPKISVASKGNSVVFQLRRERRVNTDWCIEEKSLCQALTLAQMPSLWFTHWVLKTANRQLNQHSLPPRLCEGQSQSFS